LWWCIKMRCSEWYVADEYLALAARLLSPDILQVIWRAAEAATGRVRYLHVSEEVVEGTILRPWLGADHPVGEGERVSLAGQLSATTTATMGRSSTSGWLLIHTM
jgi:hypothetical protein